MQTINKRGGRSPIVHTLTTVSVIVKIMHYLHIGDYILPYCRISAPPHSTYTVVVLALVVKLYVG